MFGVIRSGDGSCIGLDGFLSSAMHLVCFSVVVAVVVIVVPMVNNKSIVMQVACSVVFFLFIVVFLFH